MEAVDPATTPLTSSLWTSLNSWFTSTVFFLLLNLMIATIVFTSNFPPTNPPPETDQHRKQNSQHEENQPQIARSPSILHRLRSFNFYPQKSTTGLPPDSLDTPEHQQPIEIAATQFVFNQPALYQRFDFESTNLEQLDAPIDAELQPDGFNFNPENELNDEIGKGTNGFESFEPSYDYEKTEEENNYMNTYEFESLDEVYSRLKGGGHDRTRSESALPTPAEPAKMKKSASLKLGFTHLEEEEEEEVEARRPATVKVKKTADTAEEEDDVEVDLRADDFINKFKNDLKLQRIESIMKTKAATSRGGGK